MSVLIIYSPLSGHALVFGFLICSTVKPGLFCIHLLVANKESEALIQQSPIESMCVCETSHKKTECAIK